MFRYALLLTICTLLLLMFGAAVTDYNGGLKPPALLVQGHQAAAVLVGLLTIGLAVWLAASKQPGWLQRLGWIALAVRCGRRPGDAKPSAGPSANREYLSRTPGPDILRAHVRDHGVHLQPLEARGGDR